MHARALLPPWKQGTSVDETLMPFGTSVHTLPSTALGVIQKHDDPPVKGEFDLSAALRRIRRAADLSQRELARALGISAAAVARAESGTRSLPLDVLARAAALAELRLVLLDAAGKEVAGMADEAVRDFGGRRFPAPLAPRHADDGWWHDAHHWTRPQAWYTFDLDRERRDGRRT